MSAWPGSSQHRFTTPARNLSRLHIIHPWSYSTVTGGPMAEKVNAIPEGYHRVPANNYKRP